MHFSEGYSLGYGSDALLRVFVGRCRCFFVFNRAFPITAEIEIILDLDPQFSVLEDAGLVKGLPAAESVEPYERTPDTARHVRPLEAARLPLLVGNVLNHAPGFFRGDLLKLLENCLCRIVVRRGLKRLDDLVEARVQGHLIGRDLFGLGAAVLCDRVFPGLRFLLQHSGGIDLLRDRGTAFLACGCHCGRLVGRLVPDPGLHHIFLVLAVLLLGLLLFARVGGSRFRIIFALSVDDKFDPKAETEGDEAP